ncbi:uncharacterized protein K452DRAFT_331757, partial [Aplosporella prunicola CBS 121167]
MLLYVSSPIIVKLRSFYSVSLSFLPWGLRLTSIIYKQSASKRQTPSQISPNKHLTHSPRPQRQNKPHQPLSRAAPAASALGSNLPNTSEKLGGNPPNAAYASILTSQPTQRVQSNSKGSTSPRCPRRASGSTLSSSNRFTLTPSQSVLSQPPPLTRYAYAHACPCPSPSASGVKYRPRSHSARRLCSSAVSERQMAHQSALRAAVAAVVVGVVEVVLLLLWWWLRCRCHAYMTGITARSACAISASARGLMLRAGLGGTRGRGRASSAVRRVGVGSVGWWCCCCCCCCCCGDGGGGVCTLTFAPAPMPTPALMLPSALGADPGPAGEEERWGQERLVRGSGSGAGSAFFGGGGGVTGCIARPFGWSAVNGPFFLFAGSATISNSTGAGVWGRETCSPEPKQRRRIKRAFRKAAKPA